MLIFFLSNSSYCSIREHFTYLGLRDFRDVENTDGTVEFNKQDGIHNKMHNSTELADIGEKRRIYSS